MSFFTFASSDKVCSFYSLRGANNSVFFALSIRGRYTATPKAYSRTSRLRQSQNLLGVSVAGFL